MSSVDSKPVVKSKQLLGLEENNRQYSGDRQCPSAMTCSLPGKTCVYQTTRQTTTLCIINVELFCHVGGWNLEEAGTGHLGRERVCAPEKQGYPDCDGMVILWWVVVVDVIRHNESTVNIL